MASSLSALPFPRSGRGSGKSPTKELAELLLSGQNVNLWTIGISRTAQAFPEFMVNYCSPVPWAGALDHQILALDVGADSPWTATKGTSLIGDVDAPLIPGYTQADVSVFMQNVGVVFSAGTVPATHNSDLMFYWTGWDGVYRNLLERYHARNQGGTIKTVHFFRALDGGQNNVFGMIQTEANRTKGNIVNVTGTDYAVSVAERAYPVSSTGAISGGFTVGAGVEAGSVTTPGSIGCIAGAVKCGNGVMIGSCSVGGRTILGWLDDNLWSEEKHAPIYQRLADEFEATTVFWIEVGANVAPDCTDQNYVERMNMLIAKCRRMAGGRPCKIMMSDGYTTSSDDPNIDPYYVRLEPGIAAANGCAWFPTFHEDAELRRRFS